MIEDLLKAELQVYVNGKLAQTKPTTFEGKPAERHTMKDLKTTYVARAGNLELEIEIHEYHPEYTLVDGKMVAPLDFDEIREINKILLKQDGEILEQMYLCNDAKALGRRENKLYALRDKIREALEKHDLAEYFPYEKLKTRRNHY